MSGNLDFYEGWEGRNGVWLLVWGWGERGGGWRRDGWYCKGDKVDKIDREGYVVMGSEMYIVNRWIGIFDHGDVGVRVVRVGSIRFELFYRSK